MLTFIARRLLTLVPILFGLSLILFAFVRALPPSQPAQDLLGNKDRVDIAVTFEDDPGADEPLWVQYGRYMGHVVRGELGYSETSRREVGEEFGDRLPASLELAAVGLAFASSFGLAVGFFAAKRKGLGVDRGALFLSLVGISFPFFFLALLLRYVFAVKLGWLPETGRLDAATQVDHPTNFYILDALLALDAAALTDALKHIVLPAIALGMIPLAVTVRRMRSATVRVVGEDYVRTAGSKGLQPGVVDRRHILRNAILPMFASVGPQIGLLLTGLVLIEPVFSWDGIGGWIFTAIGAGDHAVLHVALLFSALSVVVVRFLADIARAVLDPRIRYP